MEKYNERKRGEEREMQKERCRKRDGGRQMKNERRRRRERERERGRYEGSEEREMKERELRVARVGEKKKGRKINEIILLRCVQVSSSGSVHFQRHL